MEFPDSKLLLKEAIQIFTSLFPGFRATTILYRKSATNTYIVNIPFIYTNYDIVRNGILVYDIQMSPIKVSFNPFASQPRAESPCGIDYTKLLFVDARYEFYALEPLLIAAFCRLCVESEVSSEKPC